MKGSAKAQCGCGPSLVLPSRSYFALGRGAPLFGCAPSLWLFVCCCRARALLGCSGGAGVPSPCCCLVRGVVLGFRKRANRRPLVGSRFVTVSKHKLSSVSTGCVTRVLAQNWTYHQSASLHSANPPSRQFARRGSGAPVSAPQRPTGYSTYTVTNLRWQWNVSNNRSRL